ncbi:MAG: hypothetical protein ACM3US_04350 [Sphingomonadaceae bacterium]
MRELDRRIATLRLRLAEIGSRLDQLNTLQRQYKNQMDRIADYALFENGDLDSAISMADEVETRLAQAERAIRLLTIIRTRAQDELDTLLLTRGVDTARSELSQLEERRRALESELSTLEAEHPKESGAADETRRAALMSQLGQIDHEMRRLRQTISEASEAAARTVSARKRRAGSQPEKPQSQV